MSKPHLVYFADPMCSWCWGFSPVIEAIQQRYGPALPIRLIVGGLRPWTTAPITAHERADIRQHWEHVRDASGQPFDFTFFDRAGFVYDTEPASRAIVVLRRRARGCGQTKRTVWIFENLERAKGFEPSTPTLARLQKAFSGVRWASPDYDQLIDSY